MHRHRPTRRREQSNTRISAETAVVPQAVKVGKRSDGYVAFVAVDGEVAYMIVVASPARTCCGTCENTYALGEASGSRVNDQITSNRSPGQAVGICVPDTVGRAAAIAGMCWCSQQMSTTPV